MHRDEDTASSVDDSAAGGSLTQTFVVRLWEAPEPTWGTAVGLRGVVEHVRTGDSVAFGSADALLAFLQTAAGGRTRSTGGALRDAAGAFREGPLRSRGAALAG